MRYKGFTLAEVLITLGVIGVVSAMTLPSLVANYQKKQNVVLLKKFYTNFSAALLKAAQEEGCVGDFNCYFDAIGVTNNSNTADRVEKAYNSILKHLNATRCTNPTGTGFVTAQCADYTINHNYDGSGTDALFHYSFVTNDGMYISYVASGSSTYGGWIVVDVNGPKKPNREGRDIFTFWIFEGNKPLSPVARGNCTEDDKYGQSCAARIIKNNWEMDY